MSATGHYGVACAGTPDSNTEENAMKLDVKALALSCGLIVGLGLFLVTWWVILLDGASNEITWVGHVYRGYNISPVGSVIGLAWGLVDGAIGGAILALLYNKLRKPEETESARILFALNSGRKRSSLSTSSLVKVKPGP